MIGEHISDVYVILKDSHSAVYWPHQGSEPSASLLFMFAVLDCFSYFFMKYIVRCWTSWSSRCMLLAGHSRDLGALTQTWHWGWRFGW